MSRRDAPANPTAPAAGIHDLAWPGPSGHADPGEQRRGRNGPQIVVGSGRSMHSRLTCASQRAENSRPPAAPIRQGECFWSIGACFARHGRSFPAWPRGNGMADGPADSRRQPVFGSRAGARADVRAPGPGCTRDGWPGCCGQHKSNTSSGPGGVQHASNTDQTAFPGTPWHGC